MNSRGKLVVISGPSGVGKGTIIKSLLANCEKTELSVSATTRQPRNEDTEGVTYFFKTVDEFKAMVDRGEFLEWAVYNNNYYGTPLAAVEKKLDAGVSVILEIDVQGAMNIKEKCPDGLYIFIAPPSVETLTERLKGRGTETDEQINARVAAALSELEKKDEYDYVVVNNKLDDAICEIRQIIERN